MKRRDFLMSGSAAAAYGVIARSASPMMLGQTQAAGEAVTFDERSVIVHGKRVLISCGEVHYARSTRAMWPKILDRSRDLGINTIATYVFWNRHETSRNVWDFAGERDLGHYLDLCQQKGLSVFLRVGPYICAEWNYGGFPPYLRDEPGITIRTMNPAYCARVENYYMKLAEVVKPHLASNGGPVTLLQVENEYSNIAKRYGEQGQEYLRWIVGLATRAGFSSVPTTTCEGGAQGAIETANGFTIPQERIAKLRETHPGTPLLWTELYPAWYRVWGGRIAAARDPRTMASSILDFVSRGGSGWNYYMWHGGTNFGRNSMYLQTPTYDFHAALDEFGSITETGMYLGGFHSVMQEHRTVFLEGDRTETSVDGKRTVTWRHNGDELILMQEKSNEPQPGGRPSRMGNDRARLLNGKGEVLFDADAMRDTVSRSFNAPAWKPVPQPAALVWQAWDEPMPEHRTDPGHRSVEPVEQLLLTKDSSDYCWYSAPLEVSTDSPQEVVVPYGGDFLYAYVDGKLIGSSKLPLKEDRGPITPEDPAHPRILIGDNEKNRDNSYRHAFTATGLAQGTHRLAILATAVGMIKGDWMIASSMDFERKGIWEGVTLNGQPLRNWTMRPGLAGETLLLKPGHATAWRSMPSEQRPLRWYRTQIAVPANLLRGDSVFQLDASGLGKGMIWVNGKGVGRHWSIPAAGASVPPSGASVPAAGAEVTYSQRYYHIPADWLSSVNEIVILEEQSAFPAAVRLEARS
jgi:beta-galactosidase